MGIASILRRRGGEIPLVAPTASIAAVVGILSSRRLGAVLVTDAGQVLGIVSERDIIHSLATVGAPSLEMTAGQLMTRALRTATPDTSLTEAMRVMAEGRFRHLPVFDGSTLCGLVSLSDVAEARALEESGVRAA
jgi:CBS domain-containing protein